MTFLIPDDYDEPEEESMRVTSRPESDQDLTNGQMDKLYTDPPAVLFAVIIEPKCCILFP